MRRKVLLLLALLVLLLAICVLLQPKLTDVDFLSLDLTIFSISLALMIFIAPILMNLRNKLLDFDMAMIKNDQSHMDFFKSQVESYKKLEALNPHSSYEELIQTAEEGVQTYSEKIKNPTLLSDMITKYFKRIKSILIWCVVAVLIHVLINEILFTSDTFIRFVKVGMYRITSGWNLSVIKLVVSSYVKLASLSLQFYFLLIICEDTIATILKIKSE